MDAFSALLGKVSSLPATTNPYTFLSDCLTSTILPNVGQSAIDQMYFIASVLALIAVLAAVSLLLRLHKRICWAFRYDSGLNLIQPHGSVSWAGCCLPSIALLEVLVARYIRLYQGKPHLDSGYFLFLSWASVWIVGSIAIWSIAASLVLHLAATGHNVRRYPLLVNIAGLAIPLLVVAAALPLGLLGGGYYRRLLVNYNAIQDEFARHAAAWSPGDAFDLAALVPLVPEFEHLVDNIHNLAKFSRATYIFFSTITLVLGVALASIGGYFLVTLRRVLSRSNSMFNAKANDEGHKRVKRSLNSLILTLTAFMLLDVGCFIVSIYGAVNPLSLSRTQVSTALTLTPFYLFAGLGVPCSVLLVHGAWHAERSDKAVAASGASELTSERKPGGGTLARIGAAASASSKRASRKGGRAGGRGGDGDLSTASPMVTIVVDVHVEEDFEGTEKFAHRV
ncbi:hypothetical protein JCM11491_006110 [Sporobolomyces phaffii]